MRTITVKELIDLLQALPPQEQELPLYVRGLFPCGIAGGIRHQDIKSEHALVLE